LSNTDLIHFEPAAASGGTWEVSNLDLEDNLIYSSTRTTGAAIHSDTGVGVVNTSSSGNSVSLVSGFPFSSGMVGTTLNIAGQNYVVATFVSSSSITLTTSLGNQTGVPYSTLNATVASAHDLLIDGFYDSIYVQGTNDTLFYNINARVPVESTFVFMGPGNSTTCLNCYSEHVGDQSWSSSTPGYGFYFWGYNTSGVTGGQCDTGPNYTCIWAQGTLADLGTGFTVTNVDVETSQHPGSGTGEGIHFEDVWGWAIVGGNIINQGGDAVHCRGGGGGVIGGPLIGLNIGYGVDAFGTSALSQVCNSITIANVLFNGNTAGDTNVMHPFRTGHDHKL